MSLSLPPPPSWDLPLPSQFPPLTAAGAPSREMTVKSFPRAVWVVTASLWLAEETARGWLGPHSWGRDVTASWAPTDAPWNRASTSTSVGEPQAGHAGARAGAAPAEQEAPQEAADGPGRGGHAGEPRAPRCLLSRSPSTAGRWLQFAPWPPGLTLIRQRLHPLQGQEGGEEEGGRERAAGAPLPWSSTCCLSFHPHWHS